MKKHKRVRIDLEMELDDSYPRANTAGVYWPAIKELEEGLAPEFVHLVHIIQRAICTDDEIWAEILRDIFT